MWRSIPDTRDDWSIVLRNAFMSDDHSIEGWRPHIGPSAWHDLDILALGPQFHTQASSRPNKLTPDEQITHMTAWALYPSPIILSCNLTAMSDFELRLFGNEEIIAVNQDRLGKPAVPLHEERSQSIGAGLPHRKGRIWARPLEDGSTAVGFFNLAESPDELSLDVKDIGLSGSVIVRNLWERQDLGRIRDSFSIGVPAHGAQLVRVRP
jgi:alpha-galactosidase